MSNDDKAKKILEGAAGKVGSIVTKYNSRLPQIVESEIREALSLLKQPCPDCDDAAFVSELRKEASKAFTGYSGICHKAAVTIERLQDEKETLYNVIEKIRDWAKAYPLNIFPEPDFEKVAEILKANNITLDAVSASNMRHVITRVKEYAEQALKEAGNGAREVVDLVPCPDDEAAFVKRVEEEYPCICEIDPECSEDFRQAISIIKKKLKREQVIEDEPTDEEIAGLLQTFAEMDDLVPKPVLLKAAVTIERLRAEIKELTEFTKCEKCGMTVSSNCLGCEIKRLQAEIKKLKEAANGQKEKM